MNERSYMKENNFEIICDKKALCWFTSMADWRLKETLADGSVRVFLSGCLTRSDIENRCGIWIKNIK